MIENSNYIRDKELPYEQLKKNIDEDEEDMILFRSRTDYMLAGVLGGLARFWEMNSTNLRVIFLVLSLLSGGLMFIVYFIMIKAIPLEPEA